MPFESGQTAVTSAVDKPFEEISKALRERMSHSQPDNVNGYRTDL